MKRTLIDELLVLWAQVHSRADLPDPLKIELDEQRFEDFDERTLAGLGDNAAVFGGLHAVDGLLILSIAGFLFASSRGRRT